MHCLEVREAVQRSEIQKLQRIDQRLPQPEKCGPRDQVSVNRRQVCNESDCDRTSAQDFDIGIESAHRYQPRSKCDGVAPHNRSGQASALLPRFGAQGRGRRESVEFCRIESAKGERLRRRAAVGVQCKQIYDVGSRYRPLAHEAVVAGGVLQRSRQGAPDRSRFPPRDWRLRGSVGFASIAGPRFFEHAAHG